MISSGASGALGYMTSLDSTLDSVFGSTFTWHFEALIGLLSILTSLGGLGVIIGGIVVTTTRVHIGRIIIMTSMAIGAISLIVSLYQLVLSGTLAMNLTVQLVQYLGWIGAIFSIEARIISEQRPIFQS